MLFKNIDKNSIQLFNIIFTIGSQPLNAQFLNLDFYSWILDYLILSALSP